MANSDQKMIALSKGKIFRTFIICLAFLLVLVFAILCVDVSGFDMFEIPVPPVITYIIFTLLSIMFGFACLFSLLKLFDTGPGFIFNEDGFTDRTGSFKPFSASWSDISHISEESFKKEKYVYLALKNVAKQAENQNKFVKLFHRLNRTGTFLMISEDHLKISHQDLYFNFLKYWGRHQGANRDKQPQR